MNQTTKESSAPLKAIDRYEIKGVLGKGASATVYKAYDPHLDRQLAIKVLEEQLGKDKNFRQSFIREGRLLAKLIHPGIVTIFDVGVINRQLYIVMELMEGFSFEKILKTLGQVKTQTLIEMGLQLSRALTYAHEQGVVHRDIKPANVMLLIDNKTVKLTDFGIAQISHNLGQSNKPADTIEGTPEYMSPEQVKGKHVDHRSDLYSLGILLYQLLAGRPPFDSDNMGVLFNQILLKKPDVEALRERIDEDKVRDDLIEMLAKLLEKDPDDRYQSAAEVTVKLQKLSNRLAEDKVIESEQPAKIRAKAPPPKKKSLKPLIWSLLIIFAGVNLFLAYFFEFF